MKPTNENETKTKLDRWLDASLARYSEDEPRGGLEERVLATLAADRKAREQNRYRWPWRLVLAGGLVMTLIVVIVLAAWRSREQPISKPAVVTAKNTGTGPQVNPQTQIPLTAAVTSKQARSSGPRRINIHSLGVVGEAAPRLPQFPTPQPMSEQERLLVAMVNSTSPQQLADDAALQKRLRDEVEQAQISGGGMTEPRGK